jgi:hypothetical protein
MRVPSIFRIPVPLLPALFLAAITACAGSPPPKAAPRPNGSRATGVLMSQEWGAHVELVRSDSIVLSLPGGQHQLQQLSRRASFTLTVGPRSAITLRLDSLTMVPAPGKASIPMVGTIWTGRMLGNRVEWQSTAGAGPVIEDLTTDIGEFFPRLPEGGVVAGSSWTDTSTTKGRVDIFEATQRFVTHWSSAPAAGGGKGVAVLAASDLEQSGKGSESGVDMTMTGQGSRSTTYNLLENGQIDRISRKDSMNVMISIPASHQLVPTVRFIRSQVAFSALTRDRTP